MAASGAVVVAAGVPAADAAAAKPKPPPPACAPIMVVGVAGSGERRTKEQITATSGVGTSVLTMYQQLDQDVRVRGSWTTLVPVPYAARPVDAMLPSPLRIATTLVNVARKHEDASFESLVWKQGIGAYQASIFQGVVSTRVALANSARRCKSSRFVVMGYSQGAMVAHRAVNDLSRTSKSVFRRIAGVMLLADGYQRPDTKAMRFGTAPPTAGGVGLFQKKSSKTWTKDVAAPDRTAMICNAQDIVCDFPPDISGVRRVALTAGFRRALLATKIFEFLKAKTSASVGLHLNSYVKPHIQPPVRNAVTWIVDKLGLPAAPIAPVPAAPTPEAAPAAPTPTLDPAPAPAAPVPAAPTPTPPAPPAPPAPPKPYAGNLQVVPHGGGRVGVAFDVGWQAGRDPVTCHVFRDGVEVFTAQCGTRSSKQFSGVPAGTHSWYATVSDQFGVYSDPTNTVTMHNN